MNPDQFQDKDERYTSLSELKEKEFRKYEPKIRRNNMANQKAKAKKKKRRRQNNKSSRKARKRKR